jgi:hypothetical protein
MAGRGRRRSAGAGAFPEAPELERLERRPGVEMLLRVLHGGAGGAGAAARGGGACPPAHCGEDRLLALLTLAEEEEEDCARTAAAAAPPSPRSLSSQCASTLRRLLLVARGRPRKSAAFGWPRGVDAFHPFFIQDSRMLSVLVCCVLGCVLDDIGHFPKWHGW